ncbi:hypothetical protein HO173_012692 [Letharia columbiana]|uniref:Uncharacterized protein n=1 Tax=Letharia columbiana TaxID=112416 RepID=A0A8H6FF05_9LECA|nr:uncharacterized protein HO173_012692 [Letharia columbiana]KAF6225920.1 hypothetical protein HO173_012692 [Letharia columbiana]
MKSLLLLTPLLLALPTTSLFILLPLYVYPGTSASAWNNATAAIAAYPKVQWQVIVNPNSGPGTTGYPTDQNFITGIAKLNSYPNVQTLGYVDTANTNRAYSAVTSDISVYAKWTSYTKANISIAGIFFDDVNNTASSAVNTYMHNASAYAYATVPSDVTPVVFNPGALAPTQLFSYCDTMVEFENPFSSYKNDTTIATIPSAYRDQSAILVYSTPATANVKSLVHTMALDGIEAVYFGADCCYDTFPAAFLTQLAAAVQAG